MGLGLPDADRQIDCCYSMFFGASRFVNIINSCLQMVSYGFACVLPRKRCLFVADW